MPEIHVLTNAGQALEILAPLAQCYAKEGRAFPAVQFLAPTEVPQPYHRLLVHERDMTSTLETFHGERMHVRLMRRDQEGEIYSREVLLILDGTNRPVEFGAIKIFLTLFPEAARELIVGERLPLGRILHECAVPYLSRPQAFFSMRADAFVSEALQVASGAKLFGRKNQLLSQQREILAEIVEILPALEEA